MSGFIRLVTACAMTLGVGTIAQARRPNIIILMPDQMRGQAMGVAGNPDVQTPQMDRLAAGGVYLPNFVANSPVCCPARATILTGLYPHGHGVLVNDLRLRDEAISMAEVLGDVGYATGFIGKWHLDGGQRQPGFIPPGPRRQGFQFWAANSCDHRHFDSHYYHDTDRKIPIDKFEPEIWMDEALRFVRDNREKPFFLWWTCGPPHNPYVAPKEYLDRYHADKLTMRPNWQPLERHGMREDIANYYAMITAIDDQIGRLLDELDTLDLAEDTIILFTSDHGDMLGSHGLPLKTKPWEESIIVPGIIRYPRKIKAGQTSDLLISHVDIMQTLIGLIGDVQWNGVQLAKANDDRQRHAEPPQGDGAAAIEAFYALPPTERIKRLHGRNLAPFLTGRTRGIEPPGAVYLNIYEPREPLGVPAAWRGVRTHRYTYARLESEPWVLYDLARDPYQMTNLMNDPAHAELATKLDFLVAEEMARTNDTWSVNLPSHLNLHAGPAVYHPSELK